MAVKRNMSPNKCPMPVQDPEVRRNNFEEVALGYTYEMAVEEAKRCLNCPKKPCRSACPVAIDIPAFIERVANEDMEGAFEILSASSGNTEPCHPLYGCLSASLVPSCAASFPDHRT